MAAAAALAAGAGRCLVLGQFQSSAQFGDAGPHTPICFGPFHPRSSAPVGRTHSPSKTHPRLATPARLNTARYKSPTRDSARLHFRFSLLSSGLCSRSSTRFLTPAPVATQRSLQNSGSKPSRVFRRSSVAPRVVSQTQPFPPLIPSNSPVLSSLQSSAPHRSPHPRGLPSSGHTTPSNLAPDAYPSPKIWCVRPKARTDHSLFPRLTSGGQTY